MRFVFVDLGDPWGEGSGTGLLGELANYDMEYKADLGHVHVPGTSTGLESVFLGTRQDCVQTTVPCLHPTTESLYWCPAGDRSEWIGEDPGSLQRASGWILGSL